MSEIKKPSLKGMQNTGHLGHFAQDKFIQQGHNDVPGDMNGDPIPTQMGPTPALTPVQAFPAQALAAAKGARGMQPPKLVQALQKKGSPIKTPKIPTPKMRK